MPNVLANIFGKSPVMPLEQHMGLVLDCAMTLREFLEAAGDGDWESAEKRRAKIGEQEKEASELKKQIRLQMPRSLLMPVARYDLLALLRVQDRIADVSKEVAALVFARKVQLPESLAENFMQFVDRNLDAVRQAAKSVRELDELFTTGFRGAEAKLVEQMLEELDAIDRDVEQLGFSLELQLAAEEDGMNPVTAVFCYRLVEKTGELSSTADRVGHHLEMLLAH